MHSMAIADPHHPMIWNVREVVLYYKLILIRFLLSWDEALSRLDTVTNDWSSDLQHFIVLLKQLGWLLLLVLD